MSGPVFELRQYTLKPGCRDTLIDLFESYFLAGQEDVSMHISGQFRDVDDPDRFVWLRRFESMAVRAQALQDFYYGPVWQAHREAANATLIDSDDVLLLKPAYLGEAFPLPDSPSVQQASGRLAVTVTCLADPVTDTDRAWAVEAAGTAPVAVLATFGAVNDFPVLPIRGDNALVWVTRSETTIAPPANAVTVRRMRLESTARSRLH
jgi:NIPSNAP